jgi:hypothetical protein
MQVYQTGDLANMDGLQPELAAKLPTLLDIRNALYSQRFRTLVEQVRVHTTCKAVYLLRPGAQTCMCSRARL